MKFVMIFIIVYILTKVSVILHELGHGLVYLKYTEGDIYVYIGDVPSENFQLKVGRINFAFNNWLLKNTGGINPSQNLKTKKEELLLYIAGPLVNMIIILISLLYFWNARESLFGISMGYLSIINLYFVLFAVIPMTWLSGPMKGVRNDGSRIRDILTNKY